MVSDLPAILDAILWRVGTADCEMWNGHRHGFWKIEKFQVCMASKLPRVVPIRARSGLVHDLGTQVTTRRGKSGRYRMVLERKFSCHPVSQFCRQRHSFRTARLCWHSEEWRKSYVSSIGPKERLHDMETRLSSNFVMKRRIFKICLPADA
ncbi:hypothetical protein TIFTF001_040285 [Ficus carica]|uniref:Uncharacterized protein n=1 Tax=Ficus carica TaxID=3494 RepID=A0AA87Z211_FICCA|nr:hypothetical protein TIFTF001_040278 [Ficus carica]GMN22545.1 hypothetical protein TIFTF001_040285 [Ficus carica]